MSGHGGAARGCSGALVGTADLTAAAGREQRTVTQLVPNPAQTLVLAELSAPAATGW